MQNNTIIKKIGFVLCLTVLFFSKQLKAQIVIGSPSLGFTQACASESFNTYSTTFIFSPETGLNGTNQFIIEMSDASGDFSDATVVFTSDQGSVNVSPATLYFSIPTTTSGENYKIRIKSTAPAATSSSSMAFAAYYKLQDSPFSINNLVSTGAYCSGSSYLLTIDNPGTGENDSPLNYPSLTFNWYKETGPTTAEFVSQGNTLEVNQEGTYFAETNYGTCTSNSFSNRVTITEAISGDTSVTIASSLGNPYCPEDGLTTLSTIGGNSYQWFKDGELIPDATNQMYQTDQSGNFMVIVDLGGCQASGEIDLVSENFESTINVSEINELEQGDILTVFVTTTAIDPEFQWFLNDELIQDAITDSYDAAEYGNYKVIINQTSVCNVSNEFLFEIKEPIDPFPDVENIPNLVSPNGDNINDTWQLPLKYVNGAEAQVVIMNSQGKIVLQTNDYQNNWPENTTDLYSANQVYYYIITSKDEEIKKGSITVIN